MDFDYFVPYKEHLKQTYYLYCAMQYDNPVLMLNILHRDYPDIAGEITRQIDSALPSFKINDSTRVPFIVNAFKQATEITADDWYQHDRIRLALSGNDNRLCKITEVREMLIAVVLLFFHPARILGLDTGRTKPGLLKEMALITGCTQVVLSQNLANAITRYRAYKGFKAEVDYLYSVVKEKINIVELCQVKTQIVFHK